MSHKVCPECGKSMETAWADSTMKKTVWKCFVSMGGCGHSEPYGKKKKKGGQ